MKTAKRKLYTYEKVLIGLMTFMLVVGICFFVLYAIYAYTWAQCAAWMCICAANIVKSCTRWDEYRKWNVIGICSFSIMFVIFGAILVWSIML